MEAVEVRYENNRIPTKPHESQKDRHRKHMSGLQANPHEQPKNVQHSPTLIIERVDTDAGNAERRITIKSIGQNTHLPALVTIVSTYVLEKR
jgi:hypothetical protein